MLASRRLRGDMIELYNILTLPMLACRRLRGDMIELYNILTGTCDASVSPRDVTSPHLYPSLETTILTQEDIT